MSKKLLLITITTILCFNQGISNPHSDTLKVMSSVEWIKEVRHGLNVQTGIATKDVDPIPSTLIKCLTPHWVHAIESSDEYAKEIISLFKEFENIEIQNEEEYLSPSGKFRLNFTRIGGHAVPLDDSNNSGIPDYIELAAAYADSSYRYMVSTLGYVDPVLPTSPYLIRFREINSYGFTQSSGTTSFIVVHRNFDGFPANDDEDGDVLGALKVTIAHEFKHAIQYATTRWQGESGQVRWIEMDATMMEEVVFHDVNDYINYLWGCQPNACSIFRDPNRSTPGSYYHATWKLYYSEAIEPEFWVDVWDELRASPLANGMIESMKTVMEQRGLNYAEQFTRNHLWHFNSGPDAAQGYGFPDSQKFPTAQRSNIIVEIDSLKSLSSRSRERAAQYLIIDAGLLPRGNVGVSVKFSINQVGLGLVLYNSDGSVTEFVEASRASDGVGFIRVSPEVNWLNVDKIGIAIANIDDFEQDLSYIISVREIPDNFTIYPSYPNPFSSRATIPFYIPEPSNIRVDIFDIQGRLVERLVDTNLGAGFHDVTFHGYNLSSGIYFYRIISDRKLLTGKMIHID
jgi:hypothetical protein